MKRFGERTREVAHWPHNFTFSCNRDLAVISSSQATQPPLPPSTPSPPISVRWHTGHAHHILGGGLPTPSIFRCLGSAAARPARPAPTATRRRRV